MGAAPPIQLASLGMADSLILMVLALVVFGPRRLPQIGRQIGKLMYEFRKASNDFKFQMEEELRLSEEADRRKKEEADRQRNLALAASTQPPAQTLEARAAIGADEQASVSAPPPAKAESGYPAEYPPETAPALAEQRVPPPRINPPGTGEQVQRQGSGIGDQGLDDTAQRPQPTAVEPAESGVGAGANTGSTAAVSGDGAQPEKSAMPHDAARTETITQHG